jgi:uncharacterized damage-inducible protein DinB
VAAASEGGSDVADRVQARKDEIISSLIQARRQILDQAYRLPPEKRDEVFLGVWSVKDLLAHLIGWDYTNLDAVKSVLEGELPQFYAHRDRDWATYNAFLVKKHKTKKYAELLHSVETSHRALMNFLATVPADEFDRDQGVRYKRYKVTIARLLQSEAEDEVEHARQIEAFVEGAGRSSAEDE